MLRRMVEGLSHPHHAQFVIPANAGIHGLGGEFAQQSFVKPTCPAMDPRVRGDDNSGWCGKRTLTWCRCAGYLWECKKA